MKNKTLIEKVLFLEETELLYMLDLPSLITTAKDSEFVLFPKNTKIITKNSDGDKIFFITSGEVEVEYNNKKILLKKKDFFGEESLFSNDPYEYEVTSNKDTKLLCIRKKYFFSLMVEFPEIPIILLEKYSKKIQCKHI